MLRRQYREQLGIYPIALWRCRIVSCHVIFVPCAAQNRQ
jgi:hypothetical protein